MIRNLFASVRRVATDRKGVTAAEYAILAVGIVIIVGAAATAFRGPLQNAFTAIGTQISTTQSSISSR